MFAERKTYTSRTLLNLDNGAKLELQAETGGYSVYYTVNGSSMLLAHRDCLEGAEAEYQRFRRALTGNSPIWDLK